MELLQSQNEVRRLLDRVSEASRDRAEMVSSKVHTHLLQIADERAMAAETRAQELENEVRREVKRERESGDVCIGSGPSGRGDCAFGNTPYLVVGYWCL